MISDYERIIRAVIEPLVDNPDTILIRCTDTVEDDGASLRDVHFMVATPEAELGKLIGRHGSVADAIRTIVNVKARDEHQRVHIKFDSFGSDEKEEDKKD